MNAPISQAQHAPSSIAASSVPDAALLRKKLEHAEAQINKIIVGKAATIRLLLAALLARGHVLLEDVPGVGKTTLAHAVAQSFALRYQRVQFTSDLLPADLSGVSIYRKDAERFEFVPGPLFTELLLADELNRGSPKTQSALLEAMAEAQITVDGQTRKLPPSFFVIATQNPSEQAGTFSLPESQLDRFSMTLSLGYPDPLHERQLLQGQDRKTLLAQLQPVVSQAELLAMQSAVAAVQASSHALDYLQRLINSTRSDPAIRFGLSPRAGLALLNAARAFAYLHHRNHVLPEDFQAVFIPVAAHRLNLRDSKQSARTVASAILSKESAL